MGSREASRSGCSTPVSYLLTMLGTLIGLAWAAAYVINALDGNLDEGHAGYVILHGLGGALGAMLVGLLARNTAGIAMMFAMGGAAVGAIIELFRGELAMAGALALTAVLLWVAQQILALPLHHRMVTGPRPVAPPSLPAAPRLAAVSPEEAERKRLAYVRELAAQGIPMSIQTLWHAEGVPVRDPADLVEGEIYSISFDLGIYRGIFHGRRWEGFPDLDDEPEVADWYSFEGAGTPEPRHARIRLSGEHLNEPRPMVVSVPVPQTEALQVFDALRAEGDRMRAGRAMYGDSPLY